MTPEEVKIMIDDAIKKDRAMQLVNHSAQIKDLKIAHSAAVDALTANQTKLDGKNAELTASLETAAATNKATEDAITAKELETAYAELEKIKPGFNKEEFKTIDDVNSYTKIYNEITEKNSDEGDNAQDVDAPAVNGGKTTLPAVGHSTGNKKKNPFGFKSHEDNQKELYDTLWK